MGLETTDGRPWYRENNPGMQARTRFIGITGKSGSGKDTVAGALCDYLTCNDGYTAIMSFARPIRTIARAVGFDVSRGNKEKSVRIPFEPFRNTLRAALGTYLGGCVPRADRDVLFKATMLGLEPYLRMQVADAAIGVCLELSPRKFMQILGTEGGHTVKRTLWVDLLEGRVPSGTRNVIIPDVRFEHELGLLDDLIVVHRDVPDVAAHSSEDFAKRMTGRTMHTHVNNIPVRHFFNDGSLSSVVDRAEVLGHDLLRVSKCKNR